MATIGTLIEGKYEILTMVGKGGMSEVYLAMDRNLNKQWAIKEIKKRARDKNNTVIVQSAMAEANLMKKLDHPCLPRIVDIIDKEDVIYVVMDYIEGVSLNKVLEKEGAQSQDTVIEWAKDLCGVLDYLHSQNPPIIYRDMKPANIMLQENGSIKLIDFGIAREYKEENLEDTVSLGTKGYAAPEQFGGKGQTDRRTDIYCLGVTLYHLVTGKNPCEPPYEIYPIRYWNPELSAGLENIILQCTQLNPDDRFDSCAELLYALDNYGVWDQQHRSKQFRKVLLTGAMVGLSVLSLIVGIACQLLKSSVNEKDYDNNVLQAEKAAITEEKIDYYSKAIEIKPEEIDTYLWLVDAFKEDASFTVEEEATLKQMLNIDIATLQEQEGYAELAYEIGKLYWYYYDYGKTETADNQITRVKSSIQWFADAQNYGTEADDFRIISGVYEQIGIFNRDITLKVEEADDKGAYAPYFENLQNLLELVAEEESEIVNLEVYKLCANAAETYARKFMLDDISQSELTSFYQRVFTEAENLNTTTDKTDELKASILQRRQDVESAVANAYAAN